MAIRERVLTEASTEIEVEAAKDRREVGCGCATEYLRDGDGKMYAYRVTVTTDNGLSKTFPEVAATEPPDDIVIVQEHMVDLVEEIRRRRSERLEAEAETEPRER
jgi:hypothetical protein